MDNCNDDERISKALMHIERILGFVKNGFSLILAVTIDIQIDLGYNPERDSDLVWNLSKLRRKLKVGGRATLNPV